MTDPAPAPASRHVEWSVIRDGDTLDGVVPLLRCEDEERAEAAMTAFLRDGWCVVRRDVTIGPWVVQEPDRPGGGS